MFHLLELFFFFTRPPFTSDLTVSFFFHEKCSNVKPFFFCFVAQKPSYTVWCYWDTSWLGGSPPQQAWVYQYVDATSYSEVEPAERWGQRPFSTVRVFVLCSYSFTFWLFSIRRTCLSEMCVISGTNFNSKCGRYFCRT